MNKITSLKQLAIKRKKNPEGSGCKVSYRGGWHCSRLSATPSLILEDARDCSRGGCWRVSKSEIERNEERREMEWVEGLVRGGGGEKQPRHAVRPITLFSQMRRTGGCRRRRRRWFHPLLLNRERKKEKQEREREREKRKADSRESFDRISCERADNMCDK